MSDKQITTYRFQKHEGLSFVTDRRILFRASKDSEAHRFPLWRECASRHRVNCGCAHRTCAAFG